MGGITLHFTSWHPMTLLLPFLNKISAPYMDNYGNLNLGELLPLVKESSIFVFESMSGLFLVKRFKRENPTAKAIYRVSDDLRILSSTHPRLIELEAEITPQFDCISVPSPKMQSIFNNAPQLRIDKHGIDKMIFDKCSSSPYVDGSKNAVIVGTGYIDMQFLKDAALANKNCTLHIIGPVKDTLLLPNLKFYGEMAFEKTIPYIKFADCGLLALKYRHEASASFTDSLKTIQYRYCGLPIVSPNFIDLNREGVYYYEPGNANSATKALREALNAGRNPEFASEVNSWDEVLKNILTAAGCNNALCSG